MYDCNFSIMFNKILMKIYICVMVDKIFITNIQHYIKENNIQLTQPPNQLCCSLKLTLGV